MAYNYRALTFAFIGTLVFSAAIGFLQSFGFHPIYLLAWHPGAHDHLVEHRINPLFVAVPMKTRLRRTTYERSRFAPHVSGLVCSGSTGMRSVMPTAHCYMPKEHRSKLHMLNWGTLTWQQLWKPIRTPAGVPKETL